MKEFDRLRTVERYCSKHGLLTEKDIIRVFPDGHECGYA